MTRRHCTAGRCFCGACGTHGAGWPVSLAVLSAMQSGWPIRRSGAQRKAAKAKYEVAGATSEGAHV